MERRSFIASLLALVAAPFAPRRIPGKKLIATHPNPVSLMGIYPAGIGRPRLNRDLEPLPIMEPVQGFIEPRGRVTVEVLQSVPPGTFKVLRFVE